MKRHFISEMKETCSSKFISKTSNILQEQESNIRLGLDNFIPVILYQLNHKLDGANAKELFHSLKTETHISFLDQFKGFSNNKNIIKSEHKAIANSFINKLFGNQQTSVLDFIGTKNKLQSKSSQTLMTVAGALVLGYLSKTIRKSGLKLDTFKILLLAQQNEIESTLPSDLMNRLGSIRPITNSAVMSSAILSSSSSSNSGKAAAAQATKTMGNASTDYAKKPSSNWVKWMLPFLFLGAFGWWFLSQSNTNNTETTPTKKDTLAKDAYTPILPKKEETKEVLDLAPEEIVTQNNIETTTAKKEENPTTNSNNTVTYTQPTSSTKSDLEESVIISAPIRIEEEPIEITSSPGGLEKGYSIDYSTMSYTEAFGSSANTDASTKQTKIKYGDYMKGISIPEAGKKITKSIKKQSKATTPGWYLESKEVLANGNSSDVKISFTKESMLKSRDTSNPLSELRHSLSLTVYNAWFGHIANPITSTEYRLYSYLSGKNKSSFNIDKYTWFDLDGVKFPSYGSTMDYEASKAQLTRIANILKAHPNVSLKLGGFTSEIGKRKSNRKISLEMAEQLKAALESLGVEPTRLSTKGYGETNPRSLNDTEFGKMRNHRVAFRVIKK